MAGEIGLFHVPLRDEHFRQVFTKQRIRQTLRAIYLTDVLYCCTGLGRAQ